MIPTRSEYCRHYDTRGMQRNIFLHSNVLLIIRMTLNTSQ